MEAIRLESSVDHLGHNSTEAKIYAPIAEIMAKNGLVHVATIKVDRI